MSRVSVRETTRGPAAPKAPQEPEGPEAVVDSPSLRLEAQAVYAAVVGGLFGGLVGVIWSRDGHVPLWGGEWSLTDAAVACAAVAAAVASGWGYWAARHSPERGWRRTLSPWLFSVDTTSVVVAHSALAAIGTVAVFLLLHRSFVGLDVNLFWAVALLAATSGLCASRAWLSVSTLTTKRMSTLLVSFIALGVITSMATSPDEQWWQLHFSHLGTSWSVSGLLFNGTLVIGGLLVTTFALYVANDLHALLDAEVVRDRFGVRLVTAAIIIMGMMLAVVGLVPVTLSLLVHNLAAMGMGVMFLLLLVVGPWLLRGLPWAYTISSVGFLGATVAVVVGHMIGYFGLTALEILFVVLIFAWFSVLIRFLSAVEADESTASGT